MDKVEIPAFFTVSQEYSIHHVPGFYPGDVSVFCTLCQNVYVMLMMLPYYYLLILLLSQVAVDRDF